MMDGSHMLNPIMKDYDWEERAECRKRKIPLAEFWPERGEVSYRVIEVCAHCPVVRECLLERIENPSEGNDDGVWGGTFMQDRRALRASVGVTKRKLGEFSELEQLIALHIAAMDYGKTYEPPGEPDLSRGTKIRRGQNDFHRRLRILAEKSPHTKARRPSKSIRIPL